MQGINRKNNKNSCDEVDTGGNHGCCVDKRRNRSRALHRIRKPDMQWKLCRFTDTPHEEQDARRCQPCLGHVKITGLDMLIDLFITERVKLRVQDKDSQPHANIADAVGEKSLFLRIRRTLFLKEETDKQIRGQTDKLPENID